MVQAQVELLRADKVLTDLLAGAGRHMLFRHWNQNGYTFNANAESSRCIKTVLEGKEGGQGALWTALSLCVCVYVCVKLSIITPVPHHSFLCYSHRFKSYQVFNTSIVVRYFS